MPYETTNHTKEACDEKIHQMTYLALLVCTILALSSASHAVVVFAESTFNTTDDTTACLKSWLTTATTFPIPTSVIREFMLSLSVAILGRNRERTLCNTGDTLNYFVV